MKKICLSFLVILAFANAYAQDTNLTQFYANPLYLNPALTGATPETRFATLHRLQWLPMSAGYQHNTFSIDHNWDYYNSGVGALISHDRVGGSLTSTTNISLSYAYLLPLGKKWAARLGLQGSYVRRATDLSSLTFQDQMDNGGATTEPIQKQSLSYPDFGTGGIVYSEKLWFGVAVHHLTRPSQSLLGGSEKLAMRISVHTGLKMPLKKYKYNESYVMPSLLFQMQGSAMQLDLGANVLLRSFICGVWYRGLLSKNDMIAGLVGFKITPNLTTAYSYDVTISGLKGSGGSHEISLIYAPPYDRRNKKGTKHLECPVSF